MKKLVSLVMVLALVLCLATAAFAEGESSWQAPQAVDKLPESVTLAAGASVYYQISNEDLYGYVLSIEDETAKIWFNNPQYDGMMNVSAVAENGVVSWTIEQNSMTGVTVGIENTGSEEKKYDLIITEPPVGTAGNPEEISLEKTNTCITVEDKNSWMPMWVYYYSYTAKEGGYLTVDVTNIIGNADAFELYMTNDTNDYAYYSSGQKTIGVAAGDTVVIQITASTFDEATYTESAAAVSFTASFEAAKTGEKYNPIVIEDKAKEYSFDVTLNGTNLVWVSLSDIKGATLTIKDADAVVNTTGYMWGNVFADGETGVLEYSDTYEENLLIGIATNGDDTKYTVTVSEPEGFDENPEKLDKIDEIEAEITYETNYIYHYQWIATADGLLTLNVVEAEWHDNVYEGFITIYDEEGNPTGTYPVSYEMTVSVNGAEGITSKDSVAVDVKAGDVILVALEMTSFKDVDGYEAGPYEGYLTVTGKLDVLGSKNNPIVINNASELAGIDVAGKGETYIAVNSMLNGQILTIVGDDNTTVTYGTTEVKADNGVFAIELSGVPTNMIVVGNKGEKDASYIAAINYPMGSANNPIVINNASELGGVDVAGKGETYIAVSSQLNGQILTIVGNANTTVTINGVAVNGEDGVFSIELTGVPTNSVVIGNTGDKDVSCVVSIEWPLGTEGNPISVTAVGDYTATVGAGEEVVYAVNAKLDGSVLTVEGASYIIVNGTKTEAKDGVATAELKASGATISVVVGNAGAAGASVKLNIAVPVNDNPPTGDAGILMPAVAALVSAMSAAVLVIKKKEN